MNKKRILSGMRSSGRLHLGNYLGATKGMLELQDDPQYETFYMVADLHGLTTPYDKENFSSATKNVIKDYLAAGLDPKKSVLFVQSQVPEHIELAYYFSTVTTIAKMSHLPTFKEKVKQYPEHNTIALLNYPILMASDILVYKAGLVPVGIDQEPHIEVAREIARRMNADFGTGFPEPQRFATKGEYIPSLSGEGKMSKSVEGSYIALTDDLQTIKSKIAKAPTDERVVNLFKFLELFKPDRVEYYQDLHKSGKIRYSEMKEELSLAIYKELEPIQKKHLEITDEYLMDVIKDGVRRAREVAGETIREVKQKMGLLV
jgi:tryptophanyl-tRNA synthetase